MSIELNNLAVNGNVVLGPLLRPIPPIPPGQIEYTSSGSYTFTVPEDVTTISFVVIGADPTPTVLLSTSVGVSKQRVFTLSLISGVQETQDMLNFCGEHNVLPEIEVISASYINEAFDRVVASDVRYRFVIDNSTM